MSQLPLILVLDIGTTWIRASLHDASGNPVEGLHAVRRQDVRFEADGAAVLDADQTVELVVEALREVTSNLSQAPAAVAVSTFWHSLVAVDRQGRALTGVTLWADRRAAEQSRILQEHLDVAEVTRRTGCPIHPSYPLSRILWLRQARPEAFAKSRLFLAFGDYLWMRLFGEAVTSPSIASGSGLYRIAEGSWDPELAAVVGVELGQLPAVVRERRWRGRLQPPFRERLPRLADVPWLLPVGDGAADSIGAGSYLPGRVTVMIGSSAATRIILPGSPRRLLPPAPGLWTYLAHEELPVTGGSLSNGGKLVQWALSTLRLDVAQTPPHARPGQSDAASPEALWIALDQALQERPPDGHGLTVLPFWAGERSPGWHTAAIGVVHGFRLTTTAMDVLQAILESIAYRVAVIHQRLRAAGHLPPDYVAVATGSALTRMQAWMRILADVLNVPVLRLGIRETTARGAALLALEALGVRDVYASPPPATAASYEPSDANHQRYEEALRRHRALYARELEAGGTEGR